MGVYNGYDLVQRFGSVVLVGTTLEGFKFFHKYDEEFCKTRILTIEVYNDLKDVKSMAMT